MSRNCVTHHHACDCREERFRELEAENERLRTKLETSQVALKGAEERAKMLLDAKSHWADRARTAESRLEECLDVLRPIALALDQGHPIEPGSFSHDEAKRLTESVVEFLRRNHDFL